MHSTEYIHTYIQPSVCMHMHSLIGLLCLHNSLIFCILVAIFFVCLFCFVFCEIVSFFFFFFSVIFFLLFFCEFVSVILFQFFLLPFFSLSLSI